MKGRYNTPEQIVRNLRKADRMLGEGQPMVEVCKHLEVTEQTYYRWWNQYGGEWAWQADDPRRLKELERENQRLKRIVADQALDIDMLKEVKCGKFHSPTQRRACALVELSRYTQRLSLTDPSDYELILRARLRELAAARPRFGYRRLHALFVREGFGVNHKRLQRLCRDEGLRVNVKNVNVHA